MALNFQKFIDNITLTDAQWDDAKKKYEGVCRCLNRHFYDIQQFCASLLMPMNCSYKYVCISGNVSSFFIENLCL